MSTSAPTTSDATLIHLPGDLIGCDVEALRQALLGALVRAQPVTLNGADVSRAGTAALQVLLAFVRDAQLRKIPVSLVDPAPALLDALRHLGLLSLPELADLVPAA